MKNIPANPPNSPPHNLPHCADANTRSRHADEPTVFIALPANRFFWSVIDTAALPPRSRADAKALGYVFENTLPVALERIHAAYAAVDHDRVIACGMLIADLESECAQHPGMLTLTPATAPEFIPANDAHLAALNLCSGAFEPMPVRSARRRVLATLCVLWLVTMGLILIGMERRIAAQHHRTEALNSQRKQVIQDAIGPASLGSSQPIELRFIAELRTLRQTRRQQTGTSEHDSELEDALGSFASFAQRWPAELNILAESLSITPTTMTLRAAASSSADVQRLADALAPIQGWQSQQPQVSAASNDTVNTTLQFKRALAAPGTNAVNAKSTGGAG